MMVDRRIAFTLATAALAAAAANAADALVVGGYDLGASITSGYRMVDVDGSKDKYREDYNLHSGLRLFNVDVGGTASDPTTAPLPSAR